MNRRNATLGVALAGVVAGAVGIGFLASPAGAGQSPTLPGVTPDALVASVLTTTPPAMAGTVEIQNNLGLPSIPGLPVQAANGTSQIRVWTDGRNHSRIALPSMNSEETIIDDGTTVYDWNSAKHTVTEHHINKGELKAGAPKSTDQKSQLDPATVARELVSAVKQTSTISVDGTDTVADRPAYDLVLTPKPNQRTLLRQIRVAIDAQTRIPLQLQVLANNTDSPAVSVGFSKLDIGTQDPSLFTFTPPSNATVVNGDKSDHQSTQMATEAAPTVVGSGWETVVVFHLPSSMTTPSAGTSDNSGSSTQGGLFGSSAQGRGAGSGGALGLVREFGKPVSGAWGSGWVISTDVGNALVTSDGRVAAGFVPQQLLISALGK